MRHNPYVTARRLAPCPRSLTTGAPSVAGRPTARRLELLQHEEPGPEPAWCDGAEQCRGRRPAVGPYATHAVFEHTHPHPDNDMQPSTETGFTEVTVPGSVGLVGRVL